MAAALKLAADGTSQELDKTAQEKAMRELLAQHAPPPTAAPGSVDAVADAIFGSMKLYIERKIEAARKDFLRHHHGEHPHTLDMLEQLVRTMKSLQQENETLRARMDVLQAKYEVEILNRLANPPR